MLDIVKVSNELPLSMSDEWFEMVDENHFWFKWRLREALNFFKAYGLDLNKPLNVLEIGTGGSHLRRQLENSTAWTIDGCDLNLDALSKGVECRGKTYLYNILEENPQLEGKYDAIILFDVIEHIEETQAFIKSAVKHLKPNGLVIVNVPALQLFYSLYDAAIGHYLRYSSHTIRNEFRSVGLSKIKTRYWGQSLVPVLAARKLMLSFKKRNNQEIIDKGMRPQGVISSLILKFLMWVDQIFPGFVLGSSVLLIGEKK